MNASWTDVDRTLQRAHEDLQRAASPERFQQVGLLCREALISLAQVVYDPDRHQLPDAESPSPTDAKRMLEAYIAWELRGNKAKYARRYATAAVDLTNELQHQRAANGRSASLCLEATESVVRFVGALSGRVPTNTISAALAKAESLMPHLLDEMSADLVAWPMVREFIISSRDWLFNADPNHTIFLYYYEVHEDLENKLRILENLDLVESIPTVHVHRFRFQERFVEYLLSRSLPTVSSEA